MSDSQFVECLNAFAAHDYQRAKDLGINLLKDRGYHWLFQVILISLQRLGNDRGVEVMGKMALDAFVEHSWQTQLLRLTLHGLEIDSVPEHDPKATCQLCFYQASSLLTRGHRTAARPLFEAAARTQAQCTETGLASAEVDSPEARTVTLHRVLLKCQSGRNDFATFLTHATVAVEIFEDKACLPESHDEEQELKRLASGFGGWFRQDMFHQEARGLYDRLSRAPIARGLAALAPRRPPVSAPPLRPVRAVLTQLATDRCSELARAAIAFGFPLFLGRHPLMASPERQVHKLLRDAFKDSQEVSPFCRRRFSGDSSSPLPRARYHAVCDPHTSSDSGTVIAEMMAYVLPNLTGYCAARNAGHGVEVVFRGLPQEPNPFYLACRDPDGVDHVFRGLPAGNVLRGLTSSPSAENVLIVPLPTVITEQGFERCLDLRIPDARDWLTHWFAEPPDGVHGDSLRVLANAHQFELRTVSKWSDLLPVLIARTTGGNALTEMVGAYLRSVGCDAFIFPSARNDFHAVFDHGTLVSASGWTLVDYRGLDPVDSVGIDVGDPIRPLDGQVKLLESTETRTRGSIQLLGNLMTSRISKQMAYEKFLLAHSTRWRLEHNASAMFARSYFWYRTRYSLGDSSFLGICDRCDNSFTKDSVMVSRVCPVCGFEGDQSILPDRPKNEAP